MSFEILQLTRMKLDIEASASEPRLLRLLVWANVADMICSQRVIAGQAIGEEEVVQPAVKDGRWLGRQSLLIGNNDNNRRRPTQTSATSFNSRKDECIRTVYPHHIQSLPNFSRPQASLYDRAAFRQSIERGSKENYDSPVESDSDSADSDVTYSDDDDESDGSDYSSEDDTGRQPWRPYVRHAQSPSNTAVS